MAFDPIIAFHFVGGFVTGFIFGILFDRWIIRRA
jgi:F0F1-type ATP synthase assembly protein I